MRLATTNPDSCFYTFQSTHPARDATLSAGSIQISFRISIHASREGCDDNNYIFSASSSDFNPRIPRGMRRGHIINIAIMIHFNPRIPRGMRLRRIPPAYISVIISIHASREGCDTVIRLSWDPPSISIHASREGCDRMAG